jgi:adenine deaminase
MQKLRSFLTLAIVLTTWAVGWAQDYDVVIKNGRVMDPETSYNSVANVGIKGGRIVKGNLWGCRKHF